MRISQLAGAVSEKQLQADPNACKAKFSIPRVAAQQSSTGLRGR